MYEAPGSDVVEVTVSAAAVERKSGVDYKRRVAPAQSSVPPPNSQVDRGQATATTWAPKLCPAPKRAVFELAWNFYFSCVFLVMMCVWHAFPSVFQNILFCCRCSFITGTWKTCNGQISRFKNRSFRHYRVFTLSRITSFSRKFVLVKFTDENKNVLFWNFPLDINNQRP